MCHGRRVDDGRWFWHCQCLPKAPSTSDGLHLGHDDASQSTSRPPHHATELHFDIEIVQLAIKRPGGTSRRRDAQQVERQAYILHFYNKSQQSQGQRPGAPGTSTSQTQADQAVQERFRTVTSKLLKLIEL